jgi:hypothetical protein
MILMEVTHFRCKLNFRSRILGNSNMFLKFLFPTSSLLTMVVLAHFGTSFLYRTGSFCGLGFVWRTWKSIIPVHDYFFLYITIMTTQIFFVENILFINLFSLFLYFKTSLLLTIIDHSDFCSKWTNLYLSSMIFNHLSSIKLLFLLWSSSMISSPISMTTILSSKTHLWSLRKKHKHHPQLCRQPAA